MLFDLIYKVLFFLGFLAWLPYMAFQRLRYGKYRKSFLKRLGIGLDLPERGEGPLVWIHAVSVGEIRAVSSLIRRLHERGAHIVISHITETGYEEGVRAIPIPCTRLFLPFDFDFILKPILERLRPDIVLVSETDFWYRFLSLAKRYGAFIALVNGKISLRSAKRMRFFSRLLKPIDLFCVQTEEYAERFRAVGASPIVVTGNLKLDQKVEPLSQSEKAALRHRLGIEPSERVIVIASTHAGEEDLLLKDLPTGKILLVPRHPERFEIVADLLERKNIPFSRYSHPEETPVILVDAMGVLLSLYQIADAAIVGGSFVPGIGGHNILEPAWFGVPVIFGPYMENQREFAEKMLEAGAGFQTENPKEFLEKALHTPEMGLKGKQLTEQLAGATEKTLQNLDKFLDQKERALV